MRVNEEVRTWTARLDRPYRSALLPPKRSARLIYKPKANSHPVGKGKKEWEESVYTGMVLNNQIYSQLKSRYLTNVVI